MNLGDINLKETPYRLPALPLGAVQRRWLKKFILGELSKAGATGEILMSYYSKDTVIWEIPPLYTPEMKRSGLVIKPPASLKRQMSKVNKVYLDCAFRVQQYGLTDEALAPLAALCGPLVLHPMVFSREKNIDRANLIFDIEFVVFISHVAERVMIERNTCACKMFRHYTSPYIGIVEGIYEGREIDVNEYYDLLYFSRGTVVFPTADLYDRLYSWVGNNYGAFFNADFVLKAISLLKFTQERSDYYDFEQQIVTLQPFQGAVLTMKSELYFDDAFEAIREVWLQVERPMIDRAKELFRMLVPAYMDAMQFKKMFGCDPTAATQSKYFETKFIAGMDEFTTMFLDTQREIREGKFVGMQA